MTTRDARRGSRVRSASASSSGPVALVTGAAGAIGRETVAALARDGYQVAALDLHADFVALRALLDDAALADRVAFFGLDVRDASAARDVVGSVVAWSGGRLDVVVNNAGVRAAGLFMHTPTEAQQAMFDVNYFGVANVTRAALPHLRARGTGHVIVVSSVGALAGLPGLAGYCASKAAVEGWAESVAMELRPFGVGVTLIEPASVRSAIWQSGRFHVDPEACDADLAHHLESRDAASQSTAGDPCSVATAIVRSLRFGARWAPTRVPVGLTALARHGARGVIPPVAQRAVMRRALALPAPATCPPHHAGASVLVTGASSGLGQGLVRVLHDRGWRVIGTVRNADKMAALRGDLGDRDVALIEMDQADDASVAAAFVRVAEMTEGVLDAVVANAGLKVTGPFEHLDDAALRTMIDVNVFGTWSVARHAVPMLRANGGGRVVIIGSSSGMTGMPGWSGYVAGKFALEAWAESVAYELEPDAISVSVIEPGTFRSEIYREGSSVVVTDGPYAHLAAVIDRREHDALASAGGPEPVIERVVHVLSMARPPLRSPVGAGARVRQLVRGVVPGSVLQRLLAVR